MNSLTLDNKRAFVQQLTEIDREFDVMIKSLMNSLVKKKADLKLDENHFA